MSEKIDAVLGNVHGPTDPVSRALGAERNLQNGIFDVSLFREPDYFIYIHTISDREFMVAQPPLFPRLLIPAVREGEKCRMVCKIPHPFNQVDREGAVGDLMVRAHAAERVAMSICNPNNLSLNQDAIPPEKQVLGLGNDLNAQGVFWSKNEKATNEEIEAAIKRRERYYQGLLERARTLEISNPKELEYTIHQDYHMAADYFRVETSWHKKLIRLEDCPNCGEAVKPGLAYHKNSLGLLCIIDPERYTASTVRPTPPPTTSVKAGS